jgi:hypothetical protein
MIYIVGHNQDYCKDHVKRKGVDLSQVQFIDSAEALRGLENIEIWVFNDAMNHVEWSNIRKLVNRMMREKKATIRYMPS